MSITFECMVLLAAFGALFGMVLINKLPRLYHPIFKHSGIHRASDDRFFLSIEAQDPKFDAQATERSDLREHRDVVRALRDRCHVTAPGLRAGQLGLLLAHIASW